MTELAITFDTLVEICQCKLMGGGNKMVTIRVLHHMARAGGTLISRCLGCMRNVILLSEIHPHGAQYFNALEQAHRWFNLFTASDIAMLKEHEEIDFSDAIMLIAKRCIDQNKG